VVNGAECEPLLASDRYVMRNFADEIVSALTLIRETFSIPRVVIGTKAKYIREIGALRGAIERAGADIDLHRVESFYPAGDEQVLIYEITGKTVPPGGIPLALGIVVINVTTALNVARAVDGTPVTRHFVTVTGEVETPTIVDAPIGATVGDLIAAAGGALVDPGAVVRGGPMMGKQYAMADAVGLGLGKADGGLIVLAADHPLITQGAQSIEHVVAGAKSLCIQCSMCTEMCPRFLIGHQIRPHRVMRSVATGSGSTDLLDALLCCECGICELFACPMGLSPRRMNIWVKGMLRAQGATVQDTTVHEDQTDMREYRRIAQSRLIDRLELDEYPTHLDGVVRIDPARVVVPTRHGVGMASEPVVAAGEAVTEGQVIARVGFEQVGCLVHASVSGTVTEATADHITIENGGARK
jgi:Na+-translocating ferredoxin:NAD+ oxidoreductase RnfC subunit